MTSGMTAQSGAKPSTNKGSPNGWSSASCLPMTITTSPHLMGLRAIRHAKWQSHNYPDMAGVDPQTICEAACWANTCTFTKFYWLDTIANSDAEFGRRVLMLTSSSTSGVGVAYLGNAISAGRRVALPPIMTLSHAVTPSQHCVGWGFVITIMRTDYSLALTVWNAVCAIGSSRSDPSGRI